MWLHLGILQLKSFFPTNIRPHRQTVPRCIYNRSRQILTTTNWIFTTQPTKFTLGIIFTTSCHCCGGTQLLSYSAPSRKFRYVLFSLGHFWGIDRLLAVFWCFCEALAVAAEGGPIWRKHARFFPTTPNWSLRRLLRTWQTSVGLAGRQTRIWPNAKPWWLTTIIFAKFARWALKFPNTGFLKALIQSRGVSADP